MPAAEAIEVLERFDGFAGLRNALREIAAQREGHWAGIPMPIEDHPLVIEPRFPNAQVLAEITMPPCREQAGRVGPSGECLRCEALQGEACRKDADADAKIRNRFYCDKRRADVIIFERGGKIDWGLIAAVHHLRHDLHSLACSDAWGIEQEHNAIQLLGTLVKHRQLKQYLLTGMFLEASKRSGLTYIFRRLKPTVVIDARTGPGLGNFSWTDTSHRVGGPRDETRILCALCMHPIAFYEGSWAGAMCPTDDVVAHLMLMRGDEPLFWRRCNQHPPYRPEAGL